MPETISSLRSLDSFPEFFLIAAITRAQKVSGIDLPVLPIEVKLTVNGTELPYSETMDDIWERSQREFDKKVLQKARELVAGARLASLDAQLDRLKDTLDEVLDQMCGALEEEAAKANKD